jgi:hypothetical protein
MPIDGELGVAECLGRLLRETMSERSYLVDTGAIRNDAVGQPKLNRHVRRNTIS